jgi:hypothetical protein
MKELDEGPSRGHFTIEITKRKILDAGYWWPTLYRDVNDYHISCDACQRIGGSMIQSFAKFVTSIIEEPIMKWGFD